MEVKGHVIHLDFHVMHMIRANIILERDWLHGLVLSLKCSYQHKKLTFDAHGAHILLMKEQDVHYFPLICNA